MTRAGTLEETRSLSVNLWENNPWQVAAIHSGDRLLKALLLAVILGV